MGIQFAIPEYGIAFGILIIFFSLGEKPIIISHMEIRYSAHEMDQVAPCPPITSAQERDVLKPPR